MVAPAIFAFGLVAFGFLGMGPVTIAVDSYGPVTDNAQSVYELSTIETLPGIAGDPEAVRLCREFHRAKDLLEENDGAGNTFKATAKPVLIGTAVVGATTMIFSIIMALTQGLTTRAPSALSILHPPFLLGLITGGAVIYWFTGASIQAVSTGAYRAVEFIKKNIRLDDGDESVGRRQPKVVAICTQYAQRGMFNIFLGVFFATLAFAFVEPFFFIGYLISIAIFGLYQAIFMANAGGAWDNAKKIVETELKMKGTELHAASVVGDTVGDPFKDTSSVAMNPIIKFTTLFGLLAVELGVYLSGQQGAAFGQALPRHFLSSRWSSSGARSTACGSERVRTDTGDVKKVQESQGVAKPSRHSGAEFECPLTRRTDFAPFVDRALWSTVVSFDFARPACLQCAPVFALRLRSGPRAFPRPRRGVRTPRQSIPADARPQVHPSRSGAPVVAGSHQQLRALQGVGEVSRGVRDGSSNRVVRDGV